MGGLERSRAPNGIVVNPSVAIHTLARWAQTSCLRPHGLTPGVMGQNGPQLKLFRPLGACGHACPAHPPSPKITQN
eukprot:8491486-Pyramimonas_sp.AAC.1